MDLSQLASAGEAVGGFAVVASLVYLALELRRNTKTMRASAAAQSNQEFSAVNETILQDPSLVALGTKLFDAHCDVDALSVEERNRMNILCRLILQRLEAQYFLYEAGILSEEIWRNRRFFARSYLELPAWKAWWEIEQLTPGYTQGFINDVFSVPANSLSRYNKFPGDLDAQ